MLLLVLTPPAFIPGEASLIARILAAGIDLVHIRKPGAAEAEVARLLTEVPAWCRSRLVIHDFHALREQFGLLGIHLTGRHPAPPAGYTGYRSASCHTLDELAEAKRQCQRVTLSPIFDSISKQGYRAAFTPAQLRHAAATGLIDSRVVALGGVCLDTLPQVARYGFGGAALLGEVWQRAAGPDFDQYLGELRIKS